MYDDLHAETPGHGALSGGTVISLRKMPSPSPIITEQNWVFMHNKNMGTAKFHSPKHFTSSTSCCAGAGIAVAQDVCAPTQGCASGGGRVKGGSKSGCNSGYRWLKSGYWRLDSGY
uniref:Uncharacterized protein n=1 Tax=Eutreptiella gymnastica TaxID=73025 RepID=A0A7S4FXL4_9EUGL|mmetsp:Transcript_78060/g.130257  ORF Transcript_78060/g.130257 Transcript_78060/m.130257 type:complete len:116 (+) Transcript_78060:94-441(+)